jgi:hypothetical protein
MEYILNRYYILVVGLVYSIACAGSCIRFNLQKQVSPIICFCAL